jgi:uncharacterized protein DUF6516
MSAPLDDIASYSAFVYGLTDRHSFVTNSTLTLAPIGATLAKLEGRIECRDGIHLEIWELIDFAARRIRTYSYEVYLRNEKICWFDAWEHPEIPELAFTFPHHKHILPDLRNHRVPAPGISFEGSNLDVVLEDVRRNWLRPLVKRFRLPG